MGAVSSANSDGLCCDPAPVSTNLLAALQAGAPSFFKSAIEGDRIELANDCSWHKAAEALATQCPELEEEADISPKWGNSRFDPEPT